MHVEVLLLHAFTPHHAAMTELQTNQYGQPIAMLHDNCRGKYCLFVKRSTPDNLDPSGLGRCWVWVENIWFYQSLKFGLHAFHEIVQTDIPFSLSLDRLKSLTSQATRVMHFDMRRRTNLQTGWSHRQRRVWNNAGMITSVTYKYLVVHGTVWRQDNRDTCNEREQDG